jgi:hypothetical protein
VPSLDIAPDTGAQDTRIGLRVKLRPCRRCQCVTGRITQDYTVACDSCGGNRLRLDHETLRFLRDFIAIFGRPIAPIEIRTKPSLPPPGAGAATASNSADRGLKNGN